MRTGRRRRWSRQPCGRLATCRRPAAPCALRAGRWTRRGMLPPADRRRRGRSFLHALPAGQGIRGVLALGAGLLFDAQARELGSLLGRRHLGARLSAEQAIEAAARHDVHQCPYMAHLVEQAPISVRRESWQAPKATAPSIDCGFDRRAACDRGGRVRARQRAMRHAALGLRSPVRALASALLVRLGRRLRQYRLDGATWRHGRRAPHRQDRHRRMKCAPHRASGPWVGGHTCIRPPAHRGGEHPDSGPGSQRHRR